MSFTLAAILTLWSTDLVRRRAINQNRFDVPNARSLHANPTPRGGGLAIAVVVLGMNLVAIAAGFGSPAFATITWLSAAGYAALGAADDRYSLSVRLRFSVQLALALFAVSGAYAITGVPLNPLTGALGLLGACLMVWSVNLYNFMDGSDGIAATLAVSAGVAGAYLANRLHFDGVTVGAATLAGASAGFLRWNWPPARIFLGDVGSYFLGAQFALLAFYT
ncbi:MAG: glycosyl transferase, partial [Gammaproteobacteria bacterium]